MQPVSHFTTCIAFHNLYCIWHASIAFSDHSEIKVSTETTFDIHINREEFLNNTEKWEEEFKSSVIKKTAFLLILLYIIFKSKIKNFIFYYVKHFQLMKFYKDENVRGLVDIIILSIR